MFGGTYRARSAAWPWRWPGRPSKPSSRRRTGPSRSASPNRSRWTPGEGSCSAGRPRAPRLSCGRGGLADADGPRESVRRGPTPSGRGPPRRSGVGRRAAARRVGPPRRDPKARSGWSTARIGPCRTRCSKGVTASESASDRVGLRLDGPSIDGVDNPDRASAPVAPGAVQVAGGRVLILGVAGGTMGGYPHVAHVISADLDRLGSGQAGAGTRGSRGSNCRRRGGSIASDGPGSPRGTCGSAWRRGPARD